MQVDTGQSTMNNAPNNANSPDGIAPENWTLGEITLAVGVFVAILAVAIGAYYYYQSTKPPLVKEGVQAPDFRFPVMRGGNAALSDYLGKKAVLVNIWNTNCDECKIEMPLIEKEYESMTSRNLPIQVLAVSTDRDGEKTVKPFLDNELFYGDGTKVKITFPVLLDVKDVMASIYQTVKYPESFLVDTNGKVIMLRIGRLTDDDFTTIEQMIQPAQGVGRLPASR